MNADVAHGEYAQHCSQIMHKVSATRGLGCSMQIYNVMLCEHNIYLIQTGWH